MNVFSPIRNCQLLFCFSIRNCLKGKGLIKDFDYLINNRKQYLTEEESLFQLDKQQMN